MRRIFAHGWRSIRRFAPVVSGLTLASLLALAARPALAQTPIEAGYRDFSYGSTVNSTPTGEKPQSKVWWNDGSWWGILWDTASNRYEIHKFNATTQAWSSTNVGADTRTSVKADALWDGSKLYVAFHIFTSNPGPVSPAQSAQLYRYSYDAATDQYSLDLGFPVKINGSNSETLVFAKDGTGQLWITWVQSGDVMVNHSVGNDQTWGTPYRLPVQGNDTDADDISSVIALPGKIGVFWSNQDDDADYFAIHLDGAADNVWQPRETALYEGGASVSDDHINLAADALGTLFVATKTSYTAPSDPLVYLLRRTTAGVWSKYVAWTVAEDPTRPIVQLDDGGTLHMVIMGQISNWDRIYTKTSSAANISFPSGMGTQLISSTVDNRINNVSGTKQILTAASDLLVIASDQTSNFYYHNLLPIGGTGPSIASFLPLSGVTGTPVTLTGTGFTGASSVRFNGISAPGFIIDSANQIRVNVPAGASTGPISVVTPQGTAISGANFTILTAPSIASFLPSSGPPATDVTVTGISFLGTTLVTFNGVAASFVVDNNNQLHATVPAGATTGPIAVTNGVGTGTSSSNFTVTAAPPVTTFTPIHDARVESANPTTNFGTGTSGQSELRVRTGPEVDSFLKFNVSGLSGPVIDARLRLFCINDSPDGGRVHSVSNNYAGTTTPWVETGLIWNNAPGVSGPILDQKNNVAINTWVEFNVTSAITGNGVFSLGMTSGLSNIAGYQSKEHANPPQLVVTIASGSPIITSFTPTSGPPGTQVTVTGSNFATANAVRFNGVSASFTIDNANQLRATAPATASSGPISITNGIGTTSSSVIFTVTPPTITNFTPTSGPVGTEVTITGTQFSTVSIVRFDGVSASFVINSPTQIKATVPDGANTAPISVVNPAGSASSASSFTVIMPPTITSFAPSSGPEGTQVVINGTQFSIATAVTFNDVSASFTIENPSRLRATVPVGATTGVIGVTNLAGSITSATPFTVLPAGAPSITSFTPTSGPVGTLVAITGVNLSDVNSVRFNGTGASFSVISSTQVTATVPGGATNGPIAVTNSVSSATSTTDFVVTQPVTNLTLLPTDDARVESENPTSNYGSGGGTRSLLRVRTGPAINTYLKFNVTGVSGTVTNARIRLFCNNESSSGGTIYKVLNNYLGTSTPWLENGLNWNNAPTIGGTALATKTTVSENTWVEFDVTSAITGNGVYSFGMTGGSTNIAGYVSKEGTTPPELVLTMTGAPAMLAGGAPEGRASPAPGDAQVLVGPLQLGPARPNPFRGEMSLRLDLPQAQTVRLVVFDVLGRRVRTLASGPFGAGAHEIRWDARDDSGNRLEAGLYLIQLDMPGFAARRKVVLAR